MNTRIVLLIVLILCAFCVRYAFGAESGPEPAPWWMQVEAGQALALKWIATVSIVLTAVITTVGALWMKIQELKDRMNRASAEKMALQKQVTELAAQLPPPAPAPTQPTIGKTLAVLLLAGCMLSASGCANPGSFTFGYTPPPAGMAKDDGVRLARPVR